MVMMMAIVTSSSLFLPFQSGRRRCVGEELGKALVFLTLASILRWLNQEKSHFFFSFSRTFTSRQNQVPIFLFVFQVVHTKAGRGQCMGEGGPWVHSVSSRVQSQIVAQIVNLSWSKYTYIEQMLLINGKIFLLIGFCFETILLWLQNLLNHGTDHLEHHSKMISNSDSKLRPSDLKLYQVIQN